MYGKCRPLRKIKTSYDVTDYKSESADIGGFSLSIVGDDIFRTLELIDSNQPYYTTLVRIKFPLDLQLGL